MFGIGLIIGVFVGLVVCEFTHSHQCEECIIDNNITHCIDCVYFDECDNQCHNPCGLCQPHDFTYCSFGKANDR